jgi:hypothetical protein
VRFRALSPARPERRHRHEFALADLHKHVRLFGFIAGYQTQVIKPQDPINIRPPSAWAGCTTS